MGRISSKARKHKQSKEEQETKAELLDVYKNENLLVSGKADNENSEDKPLGKKSRTSMNVKQPSPKKKGKRIRDSEVSEDDLQVDSNSEGLAHKSDKDVRYINRKSKKRSIKEVDVEPSKKSANVSKNLKEIKKPKTSDDEPLTDGKKYQVKKILEVHFRRDRTREFLIRWKGYTANDDTWEPEEHLDCQDLIDKFMEKVKKAKNIPRRDLREVLHTRKLIPHDIKHIKNLRNVGVRPCYQE